MEYGSVEGQIAETTTYRGIPAVRIRAWLTGKEFLAVFGAELAERIGRQHNWEEVWSGQRVRVIGQISYRRDGTTIRVRATDMQLIRPKPLRYQDIADPNFTNGRTPLEHLAHMWGNDDG